MARKFPVFFLLSVAVLCIGVSSRSEAETLITCASGGDCAIALYRSDNPTQFQQHRIELLPAQDGNGQNIPIPTTHAVTLRYDGVSFTTTCDGVWHDFGTAPGPEIQDRISCTVVADTEIHASLSLYDQNVYGSAYADCPGYTVDPYLNGTSVSSPFCVDDDHLAAASACKWQKQNLNDSILTQRGVPLNDWVVYSRTNVTDLPLSYSVSSQQYPFNDGDQVCIADLNADGDIGQDEIALCEDTPQGYLCPLAAVQCVATYSDPICPAGGSLNPDTDKCEGSPNITCPSGYTYDSSFDVCAAAAVCSGGGGLNPSTDLCEVVITSSDCPSGYTYDAALDACTKPITCPSGGAYNSTRDQCEIAVSYTCPSGYTYNTGSGQCEASPQCPSGSSYNGSVDRCVKPITPSCPSGYTYNSSTGNCEANPQCPSGGSYNTATDRCELATSWQCPVNGQTYLTQALCNAACSLTGSCSAQQNCTTEKCTLHILFLPPSTCTGDVSSSYPGCPNPLPSGAQEIGACFNVPAGKVLSTYSYQSCTTTYTCPLNGLSFITLSDCQNNCTQTQACTASCPSGYSNVGGLCIANPTCPSGGNLNTSNDQCEIVPTMCETGFTYDSAITACVADASCLSGGVLNTSTDLCQITPGTDCPSGYSYNSALGLCVANPSCAPGYFDPALDMCRVAASGLCPSGYTFDSSQDKCLKSPECPSPSTYSPTLDQCTTAATHSCPSGYDYSPATHLCEAYPICQSGSYDPDQDKCYEGDNTCPYGPQYQCMIYNGISQCSPHDCQPFDSGSIEDDDTTQGATDKQDDGQVDSNGNCLGTIYIFNGKDMRCREAGLQTGFFNCCNGGSTWFGLGRCDGTEEQVWQMRQKGLCHYIGDYCSKKLPLIGCVQKKQTRCCFNSKLGRILQEQGRPTLQAFGPTGNWGDPKSPNCRGFTAEEFQMLDFDNIDLSEWYGDIVTQAQGSIENTMQNKVQDFYNATH